MRRPESNRPPRPHLPDPKQATRPPFLTRWYKSGVHGIGGQTPPVRSPTAPPAPQQALPAHLLPLDIYLDEIKRAADRGLVATDETVMRDALRSIEYFHTLASDLLAKFEGNQE